MLKACLRGGERTNVSHMHHDLVDLTEAIQERVQDTLWQGTRFVMDKVDFLYHNCDVFLTKDNVAYTIPFYPLDKDLTQQEIEDINLHFLGYVPFENTVLQTFTTVMVNEILRAIVHELDNGAQKVAVHFAPADTIQYAGTTAYPLYGFILNNTLQMETSFFIEIIKESEGDNK